MSNKYTPLNSAEDSSSIQETIPPSYELDEITPGALNEHGHKCSPPQPLHVNFYADANEVIEFELNYYPHRGIDEIHQLVRKKLHSMEIDLGDEVYSIGVWQGLKFRLIYIDEDSIGNIIHYFRTGEELVTARAINRKHLLLASTAISCTITLILVFVILIGYFV
ncbi:hypothetical protein CLIB1423_06S03224 [[Candida] railenensis]|uniref:Uncharacterized protein n=1 Tax=[Candida] railenensis TaxID=45579 RepID=A0A9P0VY80_9ASCO|nr:hypothetical protein CLIB1423_06S03224 [[Candida] railenensis]